MSIHRHDRKTGARYEVRLRGPDGTERSRTFRTRKDAERFERDQRSAIDRGTWIDPLAGRATVSDWAADWLSMSVHLRVSTRKIYADNLRLHILPTFGDLELRKVTVAACRKWMAELTQKPRRGGGVLAAGSVHQAYRVFNALLAAAVGNELLGKNPLASVKPPRATPPEMQFLDHHQLSHLADTIGEGYRAFVLVGGLCGLRLGEMAGLRWSDVNFLRRRIEVRGEDDGTGVRSTKTRASLRTVSMPSVVIDALGQHAEHGHTGRRPNGPVFASPTGSAFDGDNFRARVWEPAVRAAGVHGLRIHDLRHTCASLAISVGSDVKVIQEMLGHASAAMTLDRYGHLMPGRQEQVADALGDLIAGTRKPASR